MSSPGVLGRRAMCTAIRYVHFMYNATAVVKCQRNRRGRTRQHTKKDVTESAANVNAPQNADFRNLAPKQFGSKEKEGLRPPIATLNRGPHVTLLFTINRQGRSARAVAAPPARAPLWCHRARCCGGAVCLCAKSIKCCKTKLTIKSTQSHKNVEISALSIYSSLIFW